MDVCALLTSTPECFVAPRRKIKRAQQHLFQQEPCNSSAHNNVHEVHSCMSILLMRSPDNKHTRINTNLSSMRQESPCHHGYKQHRCVFEHGKSNALVNVSFKPQNQWHYFCSSKSGTMKCPITLSHVSKLMDRRYKWNKQIRILGWELIWWENLVKLKYSTELSYARCTAGNVASLKICKISRCLKLLSVSSIDIKYPAG